MASRRHYCLAGGGTGGHLLPGLAVARALVELDPTARITFLTTDRPLDHELLSETPYERVVQPVRPFSSRMTSWPAFWMAWRRSVGLVRAYMAEQKVGAVLGLGGYAAGPGVVAARGLGLPAAILNPDAVPGRANRYLARRCDRVFLQWDAARRHLPAGADCVTVGCPIRAAFESVDADQARKGLGFSLDEKVVLATGASQGARTLNQVLVRVWPGFARAHPDWRLIHLTGAADEQATRRAYERGQVAVRVLAFSTEMAQMMAAADVVISRAGASTLAELTALGKPSILLPYPYHRDMHQRANADVLGAAGAAIVLDDRRDAAMNAPPLHAALEKLADDDVRGAMAAAAGKLGRPGAAAEVARWLFDAAGGAAGGCR